MTISFELGYPDDTLEPILEGQRLQRTTAITSELRDVTDQLKAAIQDSMAQDVGGLKVDFDAHIAQVKTEGTRLLLELAQVSGLPLRYDRFSGRTYPEGSQAYLGNPLSIISYA
jgi:hypothetical protein